MLRWPQGSTSRKDSPCSPSPPIVEAANSDQRSIDALVALHTRITDSRAGFNKMLETAEPEFSPTVQRFCDLHTRHAAMVAAMLATKGYMVDAEGSLMGTINRAVVAVRSFFDDVDADLMTAIRDGEHHVLSAFAEAIAQPLTPDDVTRLSYMRDELVTLLQKPAAGG